MALARHRPGPYLLPPLTEDALPRAPQVLAGAKKRLPAAEKSPAAIYRCLRRLFLSGLVALIMVELHGIGRSVHAATRGAAAERLPGLRPIGWVALRMLHASDCFMAVGQRLRGSRGACRGWSDPRSVVHRVWAAFLASHDGRIRTLRYEMNADQKDVSGKAVRVRFKQTRTPMKREAVLARPLMRCGCLPDESAHEK